MRKTRLALCSTIIALATVAGACGDDNNLDFPELSQQLIDAFCVRGNLTTGESQSGSLAASDCDAADVDTTDDGYYEVYLVRVGTTGSVTFTMRSSTIDSYLTLLSLDSYTSTTANLTLLDEDDDTAGGVNGYDATITFTLSAGTTYVIATGGYDYSDIGPYTLTIN
jgi:hypothetical protein